MKPTNKPAILALTFLALVASVFADASNVREQFQAAVAAFQKDATEDNARNLAKLSKQLDPAPAIPEEAEFRAEKGAAFVKLAKNPVDFERAAKEFQAATILAPWIGEYHYNLAVCYKSAEQFDPALTALKFAQLFSREDRERRDALILRAEVEAAQEMATTEKAAKAKSELAAKEEKERQRPTVEGKWVCGVISFRIVRSREQFYVTEVEVLGQQATVKNVKIDKQHVRFIAVYSSESRNDLTLSESGNELLGWSGTLGDRVFTRIP